MRAILAVLALAATAWLGGPSLAADPSVEPVLSARETVLGQRIAWPEGVAQVTAVVVTLPPGAETGWHTHPVPLFGWMLEGELTVSYEGVGERVYRPGDALMEALGTRHNGRNDGTADLRILAVFMGAEGVPNTVNADAP